MKLIYIAGKYRAKTEWEVKQNIDKAEAVALKYWKAGYAVFCPHKNSAFMGGSCPDETWLEGGLEILSRCDGIVMMEGWQDSKGSAEEREFAFRNGVHVFHDDSNNPLGQLERFFALKEAQ